jgi:hypothetical protein
MKRSLLSLCLPPSPCLSPFAFFFAPREALAILEVDGAAADPVRGEDKVVAIAAVVVAVTTVLAQHTRPTGKRSTCSGWSKPRTPQNDPISACLSNENVNLTTQVCLLDCNPRD